MSYFTLLFWFINAFFALFCAPLLAALHPTSATDINDKQCRLDVFHLFKNDQKQYESKLQLAMITDKLHRQRYIAIKADINHPSGFENISYYRSGQPIEIFTANWRKNGNKHSVTRLVMLGGASDKQAFDVFTKLVEQDNGHFEIKTSGNRYRFNAEKQDLTDFFSCIQQREK
ncbi:hypothetical protein [uncultured Photobacterium sp.]|uniref:hypothetical protein n=1 Tax=uncultured Photobacterium sp. TaxID=173973 RepID=UPI002634647E|nr:hypothetical protein [uncultured Photobacterium sp.]